MNSIKEKLPLLVPVICGILTVALLCITLALVLPHSSPSDPTEGEGTEQTTTATDPTDTADSPTDEEPEPHDNIADDIFN